MINNYVAKKENGLISFKNLENGNVEITESRYNEITGKKEVVTTYTTNQQHVESLVLDANNQVKMAVANSENLAAIQNDLGFGEQEK